ncbi:hypothetical protein AAFN86_20465 [Roseomonas sp. CAU 1739]|uniref:hypothetical protein n=1 Tax=Roseomonas sp. CAU 1739 TaxID=3140364 RepID=UPI00325BCDD5
MSRASPYDSPGVPLGELTAGYFLGLESNDCRCAIAVTFSAAARRFGTEMGVRDLARRLCCTACGQRGVAMTINPRPTPAQAARYGAPTIVEEWPEAPRE